MTKKKGNIELPIQEIGVKLALTDELINEKKNEQIFDTLKRQIIFSFSESLIFHGKKAISLTSHDPERDVSLQQTEYVTTIEAVDDLQILSVFGRMHKRQDKVIEAILEVNNISWWSFLWSKIRGRNIVERKYE